MAEESLRELLARLHEQLGSSGRALDAESRKLLTTVMGDIERTLDRTGRAAEEGNGWNPHERASPYAVGRTGRHGPKSIPPGPLTPGRPKQR